MVHYGMNDACARLVMEYLHHSSPAEEHKPKNISEKMLYDAVKCIWASYSIHCPIKYFDKENAYAFLAKVNNFESVTQLSIFYDNHHDKFYFGQEEELTTLKLYHELEGRPV